MKPRIAIDSIITEKSLSTDFVDATYYEPENVDEELFAKFFINIEVQGNPSISRSIRRLIYDTCVSEMYKDLSVDPAKSFEKVLKNVNDALYQLQEKEGEFLSKVSITLAALAETSFHVSVCGKAEVLLLQENTVLSLSDGLVEEVDPEHIFQNIASGDLKMGDIILVASSPLPELIKKALPTWYNRNDISPLFMRLDSELKHYQFCILGFLLRPDIPDAVLVDDEESIPQSSSLLKLKHSFKRVLSTLKHIFVPPEGGVSDAHVRNVEVGERNQEEIMERQDERISQEEGIEHREEKFETTHASDSLEYNRPVALSEHRDANDIRSALENISSYPRLEKKNKWANTIFLLKRNIVELFKKKKGVGGTYTTAKTVMKTKYFQGNRIMIFLIVVIMALVAFSIYKKNQENRFVDEIRGKILVVDDLVNKSKTQNALGEKDAARKLLEAVYASLDELKESKYLKNEISEKEKEIQAFEDQIDEVTRIQPTELANLSSKPTNEIAHTIFVLDTAVYAVSDKVLFKTLLSEVTVEPFEFLLSEGEVAVKAVPVPDEKSILIITNKNKVIEYVNEEFKEVVLLDGGNWPQFSAVEIYGRRMYVLDKTTGKVLRYSKQNNGFSLPTEYNPSLPGVDMAQAKDLSIDGDIYYLFDDGKVKRTRSQVAEDFEYSEFPRELDLSQASGIQKSALLKQLFIFDPVNKRIVVTGFRGLYAKQYVFDTLPEVKDVWLNENEKTIYVLAGDKIYSFKHE